MRFSSQSTERLRPVLTRERWRLWMLVILLGVVISAMRYLERPATVDQLGRVFQLEGTSESPQEPVAASSEPSAIISPGGLRDSETSQVTPPIPDRVPQQVRSSVGSVAEEAGVDLSPIRDNTYFRSEEHEAWFGLLSHLQEGLADARSPTPVTYAQLLKQPDEYRGQLVEVSGTVVRVERQEAPVNQQGIEFYHRLIIRPTGGGVWPFVVFTTQLPERFPVGDQVRVPTTIKGVFFKNWSYAWDEGLGLAPVVLASRIQWQAPTPAPEFEPVTTSQFAIGFAAALLGTAGVVWLVWLRTRPQASPAYFRRHRLKDPHFSESENQ